MRYWIGFFSLKRNEQHEWKRNTEFIAIHDSFFESNDQDHVYLYTTELRHIAKFSSKELKDDWNITTIKAGPALYEKIKQTFKKQVDIIEKTIVKYSEGIDIENEYGYSFARDHDGAFGEHTHFYTDIGATDDHPESLKKRNLPHTELIHLFIPKIYTAMMILKEDAEEGKRQIEEEKNTNHFYSQEFDCENNDGISDHDLAREEYISELFGNADDYERSSEEGWFYED